MKIWAGLFCAAALGACASPTITYQAISGLGNTEGRMIASLPVARIVFSPPEVNDGSGAANPPEAGAPAAPARGAAARGRGGAGGASGEAPGAGARGADAAGGRGDGGDEHAGGDFAAVSFHSNRHATFLVRPHDDLFSATRLAPTYRDDTSVMATLNVQTIDRREEFAQDLASVISAFGDPTILNAAGSDATLGANAITCDVIEPRFISWLLATTADAAYDSDRAYPERAANEDETVYRARLARPTARHAFETAVPRCRIYVSLAPPPNDAVTLDYFNHHVRDQRAHVLIGAACRQITVDYVIPAAALADTRTLRWTGYVPDPYFVRLSPLPYSGKLDQNSVCAAASLEQGEAAPASGFHIFRQILAPFRNGSGSSDGGAGGGGGGGGAVGGGRGR